MPYRDFGVMAPPIDDGISDTLDNQDFEDQNEEDKSYYIEDEIDADDIEKSENVGFGTNAIITAINNLAKSSNPPPLDVFLINVDTLIRNTTTKEKTLDEIKSDVKKDLAGLLDAITIYLRAIENLIDMPYVIVYLPEYEIAQVKLHERPFKPNSTKDIIKKVHNKILEEDNLKVRKQIRTTYNNIDIFELWVGDRSSLPYKALIRFINSQARFNPGGITTSLKNMLLISHYPLDFYLTNTFSKLHLIESFTGKIFQKNQLGLKVFKNGFIPFNRVTHLLFGDSVQIMPMAKGRRGRNNNRKLLMDMAKTQNWNFRTPDEIAQFVGNSGQVPKEILMNIRF